MRACPSLNPSAGWVVMAAETALWNLAASQLQATERPATTKCCRLRIPASLSAGRLDPLAVEAGIGAVTTAGEWY